MNGHGTYVSLGDIDEIVDRKKTGENNKYIKWNESMRTHIRDKSQNRTTIAGRDVKIGKLTILVGLNLDDTYWKKISYFLEDYLY